MSWGPAQWAARLQQSTAAESGRLTLARGIQRGQAEDRAELCGQFDSLRRDVDVGDTMRIDHHQSPWPWISFGKAEQAFQ